MGIRQQSRIAAAALAALAASAFVFVLVAHLALAIHPDLLSARAVVAAESACGCKVEWDSWSIVLLQGAVSWKGFRLEAGEAGDEVHRVRVRELSARLRLASLLGERPELAAVRLRGLDYEVREWDGPSGSRPEKPERPRRMRAPVPVAFSAASVTAESSRFVYRRFYGTREATVSVDGIELAAGPVYIGSGETRARLTGRLEESGALELRVQGDFAAAAAPPIRLYLGIAHLRLADANDYFRVADGIELAGELLRGEVELELKRRRLVGEVNVRYRGLDAKFLHGKKRGAFGAFVRTLASDLIFDEENIDPHDRGRRARIAFRQRDDESVFRFLLRGMREGALAIASSHSERDLAKD